MLIYMKAVRAALLISLLLAFSCTKSDNEDVEPKASMPSAVENADDCAIWIHPTDRLLSLIIGNDNQKKGGLFLWDLSGKEIYHTPAIKEPMHMDVRYGMRLGGNKVDIVACPIRGTNIIKVYAIDPQKRALSDITTTGGIKTGFSDEPYGFCLYQEKSTGKIYAFVSKNEKGANVHQILLEEDGAGLIKGALVRSFGGEFSKSIIEGMVADDAMGHVYLCDQDYAILKFDASQNSESKPLNIFAQDNGIQGMRKGISLYTCEDGKGYLILSSQGDSTLKIYERGGENLFVTTIHKKGSTQTDGIDSTSCAIPPKYPFGFVVCHNKPKKNFVIYNWEDIAKDQLIKCSNCK